MYVQQMLFMFNDKLWKGGPYLQRSRGMSHPSHMILCPYLILRQMGKKLFKSGYKLKDLSIKQKLVKTDRFRHENIVAARSQIFGTFFHVIDLREQIHVWTWELKRKWYAKFPKNQFFGFRFLQNLSTEIPPICRHSMCFVLMICLAKIQGVLSFKGWPGWLSPWSTFRRWFSHGWVFPRWGFRVSTAVSSKSCRSAYAFAFI